MQKPKGISGKINSMRPVDYFIVLLFVLVTAMLVYLLIDSRQKSRDIKEELNTKTSITQ